MSQTSKYLRFTLLQKTNMYIENFSSFTYDGNFNVLLSHSPIQPFYLNTFISVLTEENCVKVYDFML